MEIEKIIYYTTRGLHGIDDKLAIATIIIFTYKWDTELFAELLYCENKQEFINKLNNKFADFQVDFSINLYNKNVKDCFDITIAEVIQKYDKYGFYKAVFEKDEFALVILNILETNFKKINAKEVLYNIKTKLF